MTRCRLVPTLLITLLLAGPARAQDLPEAPVPDTRVRSERPDLDAAILGAALEMRGQDVDSPAVEFTPAARSVLRADGFDYAGFGRPRYALGKLVESESDPGRVEVGAVLSFVDALLRRTTVSVLLTCSWADDGRRIVVHRAVAGRAAPPVPKSLLTIVLADRVPEDLFTTRSHAALLSWMVENRATEEELRGGSADECTLFAVVYDRLPAGSRVMLAVSEDPAGPDGETGNAVDVDCYHGWHVAVMRGRFDWRCDRQFYVKVLFTPPGADEPRPIEILSSDLVVVDESGRPIDGRETALLGADATRIFLAALGLVGLAICFLGLRMRRLFWGIAGLAFGGSLVLFAPIDSSEPWKVLAAVAVAAVVGAVLMARAPLAGRLAWGAAVGGIAGCLLAAAPVSVASPVLLGAVTVGAVLAAVLRRSSTIVISSLLGSAMVAVAAGHWLRYYDAATLRTAFRGGSFSGASLYDRIRGLGGDMQVFLVLAFVLFAAGVAVQITAGRRAD